MAQATYAGYSDDDLVATIGQLHAAEAATRRELCRVVAEYERREAFYADGARTMADWLVARFGMAHRSAVELARVAAELESLPALAGTLAEGRLGWDQAAAAASFATPETDEELAHDAPGVTAAELRARARRERPPSDGDAETNHRRRSLRLWWERDRQNLHISGQVPALAGAVIETALRRIAEGFPPDPANGLYESIDARMADALEALASTALAEDADGDRATVVIHVEAEDLFIDGLGELEDGGMVSAAEFLAAACDARVQFVAGAEGAPIGIGRRARTVPRWLYRLLKRRDHGCPFRGCGRTRWVHAHHIIHWADGGPTDLENLVLLCSYHHRAVHRMGLRIEGNLGGEIRFIRRDGWALPATGPPAMEPDTREWIARWLPPAVPVPSRT